MRERGNLRARRNRIDVDVRKRHCVTARNGLNIHVVWPAVAVDVITRITLPALNRLPESIAADFTADLAQNVIL